MTKRISLTQGQFAIVDDDLYDELNQHTWYAQKIGNTCYAKRGIWDNGKTFILYMHRQILGLYSKDGRVTDHINHNGLDNRVSNLRVVNCMTNTRNCRGNKNNTSGHNGVCWHELSKKWNARITVDYKRINLGYYSKIDDAIDARKQGELSYW